MQKQEGSPYSEKVQERVLGISTLGVVCVRCVLHDGAIWELALKSKIYKEMQEAQTS